MKIKLNLTSAILSGIATSALTLPMIGDAQITSVFTGNASNGVITEFDASGNLVRVDGGTSVGIAVGGNPYALTSDGSGDLFIANSSLGEIQEITTASLNSSFASATTFATAGVSTPIGLAFNSSGDLFVANEGSSTISEYSSTGTQIAFTVTGATVSSPTALTIDGYGNLYVAQIGGSSESILKITPGGVATTLISGLSFPNALAVNNEGDLFVSEESSGQIAEIKNGVAVPVISLPDFAVNGLAFDTNNDLFIAEGHQGDNNILELTNGVASGLGTFAGNVSAGDASGGIFVNPPATPTPEPGTLALGALGGLAFAVVRKFKSA